MVRLDTLTLISNSVHVYVFSTLSSSMGSLASRLSMAASPDSVIEPSRSTRGPAPVDLADCVTFPPLPSSTGKCYYVFLERHGELGPCVVAGSRVALAHLGGSWTGRGRAPRGFPALEDAVKELLAHSSVSEVRLVLQPPENEH